jgi:hypothetical protein
MKGGVLMVSPEQELAAILQGKTEQLPVGHDHFWERALSRREFLGRTAGVAGFVAAAGLGLPGLASAGKVSGAPQAIPGGTTIDGLGLFHFYFPTTSNPVGATDVVANGLGDPSTIFDFNGFIGLGDWGGGSGSDGHGNTLYWAADLRFIDGEYVDVSGRHQQGAFAFI